MNAKSKSLMKERLNDIRDLCMQGCFNKSARNCLMDVGAIAIELIQLLENADCIETLEVVGNDCRTC